MYACASPVGAEDAGGAGGAGGAEVAGGVCRRNIWKGKIPPKKIWEIYRIQNEKFWREKKNLKSLRQSKKNAFKKKKISSHLWWTLPIILYFF